MTQNLPANVRELVRATVYEKADAVGYLSQGRIDNGRFISQLAEDPNIVALLSDYMPKSDMRTYIKDAILNRYAKDWRNRALQKITDEELLKSKHGEVSKVGGSADVSLYCTQDPPYRYYVISTGTCIKWETALRKALEYVVQLPKETQEVRPTVALKCVTPRGVMTKPDKDLIETSLDRVGIEFYVIEF
ncbi:hypothetical protein [uncultured Adlercreutzia sp.]|uniref:hypothetical protein n=1 Tax=uncultured Adlercreutzia sp. TaxID=875803 RepID=UPI0025F383F1|nr:hypothetical protein [uncultured Adlercreutzia sp.]